MKKSYLSSKVKNRSSKETQFTFSLKHIVMSFLLLMGFIQTNAQCTARTLPYSETFSSTSMNACTPTTGGWIGNSTPSQAAWDLPGTNYAGGNAPEIEAYGNQSNGGVSETLTLISPPVKTLGISTATLSFKHALNLTSSAASGSNVITIKVESSPDKTTWTQLYSNTYNATSSLSTVVAETRTLTLSGLSSDSTFIRFSVSGVLFKVWGWEIDDVNVTTNTSAIALFHPNEGTVYPNPARENLVVNGIGMGRTKLVLLDVIGNTVFQTQMNNEKINIDVRQFPAGMYLLQMQNEKGISARKINIE